MFVVNVVFVFVVFVVVVAVAVAVVVVVGAARIVNYFFRKSPCIAPAIPHHSCDSVIVGPLPFNHSIHSFNHSNIL